MRKLIGALLLCLSFAIAPAAHAQFDAAFNQVAPVAGVGMGSPLTLAGTGLSLSQPLSTRDSLSNEYGITLPNYFNNTVTIRQKPVATRATLGCFGTCFF